MAITVIKQPAKYSPSNNPLFLTLQSSSPNVIYFNIDLKSNGAVISRLKIYPTPSNPTQASIDLSNFLKNYTSTPLANNSTFYSGFDNGYLNYSIEVEDFAIDNYLGGSVNGVFVPNPNAGEITANDELTIDDLCVYNSQIGDAEFQYFGYRNYYVNPITTAKFLSTKPSINNINPWSKEFLYFLADGASTVAKAIVEINNVEYDVDLDIDNTMKLHRLNVSPKSLITSLSINFDNVKRYEVYLVNANGEKVTETKTYNCINLPCNYEPVNILWINKMGGVDSFTFINPKESKDVKRSSYQVNRYKDFSISNGGVINQNEKTYNVSQTSNYTLTTPALNDWEYIFLTDMLSSEQVYVELVDGSLYPIKLITTSAEVKRKKYQTEVPRFNISYAAESNLNLTPDSYLSFAGGLSQIGWSVPQNLAIANNYFETVIGDATSVYYVVNHNLQSFNVAIDLVYVANNQTVYADVVRTTSNTVTVEFAQPIANNSIKIMVSKLD